MGKNQLNLNIDTDLCMGCCACEIACKMEYELPRGVRYIIMRQSEEATPAMQRLNFHFDICRQCDDAECINSCPDGAIYQDEQGIILVKEDVCTGCKLCLAACPYDVPQFLETKEGKTVMQKCFLCHERLEAGLLPACQTACPAGAITLTSSKII